MRIRRRLRPVTDESGLTIVEVLVAALVLVIGSLAVFAIVDAATKTSFRSEQSQVGVNLLQQEMEQIRSLPYDRIAMTGSPGSSLDPDSPLNRVVGTRFRVNPEDPGDLGDMVLQGHEIAGTDRKITHAAVNPGPTTFQVGDITGNIYRFVTWASDPSCRPPGCESLKLITVIMELDETPAGGKRSYREISSVVVDPLATTSG